MRYCGKCGEQISSDVCPYCGVSYASTVPPEITGQSPTSAVNPQQAFPVQLPVGTAQSASPDFEDGVYTEGYPSTLAPPSAKGGLRWYHVLLIVLGVAAAAVIVAALGWR